MSVNIRNVPRNVSLLCVSCSGMPQGARHVLAGSVSMVAYPMQQMAALRRNGTQQSYGLRLKVHFLHCSISPQTMRIAGARHTSWKRSMHLDFSSTVVSLDRWVNLDGQHRCRWRAVQVQRGQMTSTQSLCSSGRASQSGAQCMRLWPAWSS